ncbi:unnamed protein product [Cuscuta campestris]|uniref:Uncharacterized protein n=1 Tax=Cuscuta campestris TaxID=132261 RepID=A0A484MR40_9ASTE|nr:unnamed protein product [Cuscuta campestris]
MRLQSMVHAENYHSLVEFAEWIANIGDGNVGDEKDGCAKIVLPDDIVLKYCNDPIEAIVQSTYPDFNIIANDPSYLQHRAILAPTLDVVDAVNDYMTSKNVKEESKTSSSDTKTTTSPPPGIRRLKILGGKMVAAAALGMAVVSSLHGKRRRSPKGSRKVTSSSSESTGKSGRRRPPAAEDSQRSEAIDDCIKFINSSSSSSYLH